MFSASRFRSLLRLGGVLVFCCGLTGPCPSALARDPGGGDAGQGADVTLTVSAETVTLNNGVIRAVIQKATGRVESYVFDGTQMVDPGNPIYYSLSGGKDYEVPWGCVFSVISQTADMVELSCKRNWRAGSGQKHAFDLDLHYILRRGDTGLYAYVVVDHPAAYPEAWLGEWRIVWKLPYSESKYTFDHAYVDELRNGPMPSRQDYRQASPSGIAEIVRINTGRFAGRYDGKYSYSARYSEIGTWGLASESIRKGVWIVLGGQDYFNDGPTKQDLTLSESYLLLHFVRNHYHGAPVRVAAGEPWRKLFGPFLLYCNRTSAFTDPGKALWADARAQVVAEQAAWPYAWLVNEDHPAASGRGAVTGKLIIADALKPSVSAAGAHVGLAAPEAEAGNWQFQAKGYQYWTRADADGRFVLPAVRPGSYTLHAFNDGAVGEFFQLKVTVAAGETNDQGTLAWNVSHPGASIAWEIGVPDRTAREFRHGTDYFQPYLWDKFSAELENPLVYTIGASTPDKDWNYVHCALPGASSGGAAAYADWRWLVDFDLDSVPPSGNATLTIAFASAHQARLWLHVNGGQSIRISPPVQGGNALLRQGIHAKYSQLDIPIPVSRLKRGRNTFTFLFSSSDQASHVMYDYLRLELPAAPGLAP
jgi:rhamnogalacturonan endolyase